METARALLTSSRALHCAYKLCIFLRKFGLGSMTLTPARVGLTTIIVMLLRVRFVLMSVRLPNLVMCAAREMGIVGFIPLVSGVAFLLGLATMKALLIDLRQ